MLKKGLNALLIGIIVANWTLKRRYLTSKLNEWITLSKRVSSVDHAPFRAGVVKDHGWKIIQLKMVLICCLFLSQNCLAALFVSETVLWH